MLEKQMDISDNNYIFSRKTLWVLALFCIAAFFLFLGSALFNTRGEPREAIVAVSMLDNGDWILPVNNGTEIAFKPPLLHWCIAAAYTLTGAVTEYTSRLPSALSLCLMTLCLFAFFAKRSGERAALLTALITLTNFEVHRAGYACRVDMLLAALMVLALLALYRWWEQGLRGVPWGAAACLAGAALTKGPVGVLLPCACAGLFYLLRGVRLWSAVWRLTLVALAALLPLGAWYCAAYMQPHGGDRFLQLIYEENVLRLMGKMTYASHINPWWYNVQTILTGMLPYTLLLLIAPFFIRRGKSAGEAKKNPSLWQKVKAYYKQMPSVRLYAAVCTAVIFVFYCIPASKRSTYLLPLYPFLSYFVAEGILWLAQKRAGAVRAFCGIVAALGIVLTLLYICILAGLVPESIAAHVRHADQNIAFFRALQQPAWWQMAVIAVPLMSGLLYFFRNRLPRLYGSLALWSALLPAALFFALDGAYQPLVLNAKSDKRVAEHIALLAPEGTIYSYRTDVLLANRMHPFTVNFYLHDRIIPIDCAPQAPAQGWLLTGNEEIEEFKKAYPQYAPTLVYDSRHRSCDDKKFLKLYRFEKRVGAFCKTSAK